MPRKKESRFPCSQKFSICPNWLAAESFFRYCLLLLVIWSEWKPSATTRVKKVQLYVLLLLLFTHLVSTSRLDWLSITYSWHLLCSGVPVAWLRSVALALSVFYMSQVFCINRVWSLSHFVFSTLFSSFRSVRWNSSKVGRLKATLLAGLTQSVSIVTSEVYWFVRIELVCWLVQFVRHENWVNSASLFLCVFRHPPLPLLISIQFIVADRWCLTVCVLLQTPPSLPAALLFTCKCFGKRERTHQLKAKQTTECLYVQLKRAR